jgi:HlyD family secretion protein
MAHFAFLGLAAYRLMPAIQQVYVAVAHIRADRVSFERIAGDWQRARLRARFAPTGTDSSDWMGRPRLGISLVDVSYRHSMERASGVSAVSLDIPAGAFVGLIGPNGAGKTTLAELILGLLKPDDGGNRYAWFATVAYVPQNIVLLDGTVAENVAFGVTAENIDQGRVTEAVQLARLQPVLDTMPKGLATMIGENGVRLSSGQRQRVGIARALYRRASLLVLDEATNALDKMAQDEIIELLSDLRGKCTMIAIAHQRSVMKDCDMTMIKMPAVRVRFQGKRKDDVIDCW